MRIRYVPIVLLLACSTPKGGDPSNSSDPASTTAAPASSAAALAPAGSAAPVASSEDDGKGPIFHKLRKWKKEGIARDSVKPLDDIKLIAEYSKNPIAGDAAHKGKPAALVGAAFEIGKDPDGPYVELVGGKGDLADHRIRAYADPDDAETMAGLAKASKGDECMFACDTCKGWDDVMYVEFTGCAVECKKMR